MTRRKPLIRLIAVREGPHPAPPTTTPPNLELAHAGPRASDGHLYSLPGELDQDIAEVIITDHHGDGRIVIGCYDATGTQIAELAVLPEVLQVSPAVRRALSVQVAPRSAT